MEYPGKILLPAPNLPKPLELPTIPLRQPKALVPSYKPMIIPPSDLEAPEGVKTEEDEKTETPTQPTLKIPVIDIQMPIPETAVVVTAVTTAVIAVTTTTITQSLFEPIKKKVQKQLQSKVDAWKKKRKEKASSANLKTPQKTKNTKSKSSEPSSD